MVCSGQGHRQSLASVYICSLGHHNHHQFLIFTHSDMFTQTVVLVVLVGLAVAAPSNTYSAPAPTYSAPHQPSYDQVTYTVDGYNGYVADVQYYGEAQFPHEYGPAVTFPPQSYGHEPSYH
ncbi:hypothetical protein Pcinc_021664 [Petrolisthes cinctipes]|uniref:Uncharacterized protein n=1 Tax=Petrolisthes cinctipes TaxID=88211 RepID=A0AAE1FGF2_PETCI|nr:hypothetical protein Pcinc_021660 [Petrolisthes cinctipes]KAK3873333.1 hypothetical protein Pcinc_021662 [Petrolisthes cinctipes]KAK3873335.1 hypothetical protein Pcinc_021664 [Petrolisthes cinctipes]